MFRYSGAGLAGARDRYLAWNVPFLSRAVSHRTRPFQLCRFVALHSTKLFHCVRNWRVGPQWRGKDAAPPVIPSLRFPTPGFNSDEQDSRSAPTFNTSAEENGRTPENAAQHCSALQFHSPSPPPASTSHRSHRLTSSGYHFIRCSGSIYEAIESVLGWYLLAVGMGAAGALEYLRGNDHWLVFYRNSDTLW